MQLEREFSERRDGQKLPRSCIWEKYRRGEIVPRSGKRPDGSPNLLERVEVRYPGTTEWLYSPLWRLADKAPMAMSEIKEIYRGLPKLLKSVFIAPPEQATGIFWRRDFDVEHACEILLRYAQVDGFVALLALVKEAEITQDQWQHEYCVFSAASQIVRLTSHPIVGEIFSQKLGKYLAARWNSPGYFDTEM